MYKIQHLLDENEKVTILKTDKEFIEFVNKVRVENDDTVTLDSVWLCIQYLIEYCPNLKFGEPDAQIILNRLAKKIGKLTDNNNHNQSVLELAQFLKDEEAIEKMNGIKAKHLKAGSMDYAWISERNEIRVALLQQMLLRYGKDAMNKISSNF